MKAKKQLRKPENWEDFESLCKKLWGEIWQCTEVKKNGRKGQIQYGVDIYGIPKGETSYYGIQCKGKDEYSHKQLSIDEIDKEIELAKSFNPPLKKLYFTTTANKDAKIEEYIRIKDLESRQESSFEVHLFSWEDIADLIDENKRTHDWYLNLQEFKGTPDVLVCFENDDTELKGLVLFCDKYTHFIQRNKPMKSLSEIYNIRIPYLEFESRLYRSENKSYFRFGLKIINIGDVPIENPKLIVQLNGNYDDIDDENIDAVFTTQQSSTDLEISKDIGSFSVIPRRTTLALEEEYHSSKVCIKPKIEGSDVRLDWKLISNHYCKEGFLRIKIDTYFKRKDVDEYVEFRQHVGIRRSIEDYFDEDK